MHSPAIIPQHNIRLVVVLVGLPARGKTYISRKIARYLAWLGYVTRIFNVGNYRRDAFGASVPHEFFDPTNEEYSKRRFEVALMALDDVLRWFGVDEPHIEGDSRDRVSQAMASLALDLKNQGKPQPAFLKNKPVVFRGIGIATSTSDLRANATSPGEGAHGGVAVYDATNSTKERRQIILDKLTSHGIQVMFVESICEDEDVVLNNIREVKISSPDYVGVDPEVAAQDFMQRIKHYEKSYEPISVDENGGDMPMVKLVNVGSQVIVNKIQGYLQSRIVYFLMNLNITPRHIYFSRHGESMYNVEGKLGGDSDLSPRGRLFAKKLPELIEEQIKKNNDKKLTVWTSTLRRTIQTAELLPYPQIQWKHLDELDSGVCDGYTYEEISQMFPNDFQQRDSDKYNYRYIGGESYRDLVQRLEPVIMELERHHEPGHSLLIIGHQAVLRCIYAYYMNYSHEELPYLKIPLHSVVKITPKAYHCVEERYKLDVPAVNTHREKGSPSVSPTGPNMPFQDLANTRPSSSLPQLSSIAPSSTTPNPNSFGVNNVMPKPRGANGPGQSPLRHAVNSPRIGASAMTGRRRSITSPQYMGMHLTSASSHDTSVADSEELVHEEHYEETSKEADIDGSAEIVQSAAPSPRSRASMDQNRKEYFQT
ncbi:histidine phosphatase superfamily [Cladochytrium replicatum]|nr:histidine phosphatase superfamily [Cladochytrium replicatum]